MEQVVSRDGTVITYRRTGKGPPLLLVHGVTADHRRWAPVSPQLERHFTVYAMDRRGRGQSGDGRVYDMMREAEDVAAVVDAIDGPVTLLGHSYGANCSLEAALLTDSVHRLILYEPDIPGDEPLFPPELLERMQELVDRGESEAVLEVLFRDLVGMPDEEFEAYRRLPMWRVRVSLAHTVPRELKFDQTYRFNADKFAAFHVPTLLLLGEESPAGVQQSTETVRAALRGSRVAVLAGQQHVAMDMAPDVFVEEVRHFILG